MMNENMDPSSVSGNPILDLDEFSDPKDILRLLLDSKQRGTTIGIRTPVLGRTMVMTGVQDLIFHEAPLVVLRPYDMSGHMLPQTTISLEDIQSVRPFVSRFENPFITKLSDGQESLLIGGV
jgi:hypothetical protein